MWRTENDNVTGVQFRGATADEAVDRGRILGSSGFVCVRGQESVWTLEVVGGGGQGDGDAQSKDAGVLDFYHLPEVSAAVFTAHVMFRERGERSAREEAFGRRGQHANGIVGDVVPWGGQKTEACRGLQWWGLWRPKKVLLPSKACREVDNRLADGIARWPEKDVYANLMRELTRNLCQVHDSGSEVDRIFKETLREATHVEESQIGLARDVRGIGSRGAHGER